jgi:hypothetical protein
MQKQIIRFFIVCTIMAFITSCGMGPNKLYDINPPKDTGILIVDRDAGDYVVSLDGSPPQDSWKFYGRGWRIELLPGWHTVTVGCSRTSGGYYFSSVENAVINFNVEAGKSYTVVSAFSPGSGGRGIWTAKVEEVITGEVKKGAIPQAARPEHVSEIYFINEFNLEGYKFKLIFDNVNFFNLGDGRYTMIGVDPGKHVVGVRWPWASYSYHNIRGEHRKELYFKENERYYFNCYYGGFEELPKSEGEALLKKCRYVPCNCYGNL